MRPDPAVKQTSRTSGDDRIVDEMVFQFIHTIGRDWRAISMAAGVAEFRHHCEEFADRGSCGGTASRLAVVGKLAGRYKTCR